MDQSSFRAMLGTSQPSTSGSGSSTAILGGGSRKRGFQQESAIPSAPSNGQGYGRGSSGSSSGLGQFRPRGQQQAKGAAAGDSKGKGKGKEQAREADKDAAPSYKRYGYVDRASMRRAGLLERTDGPAPSFDLDQDLVTRDDEPAEPPKTEEEVERELEEAERALQGSPDADTRREAEQAREEEGRIRTAVDAPAAKKQKRSRLDMLRDLQAKMAAASSGAVTDLGAPPDAPASLQANGSIQKGKDSEAREKQPSGSVAQASSAMKGFKVVERAPEKPKKKKKKAVQPDANGIMESHPDLLSSAFGVASGSIRPVDTSAASKTVFAADEDNDDIDIFAGAGDYEDENADPDQGDGEEEEGELGSATAGPQKYFDDQEELIPKFETYRSPTPPLRGADGAEAGEDGGDEEGGMPQRLQGLSHSSYTAKELLELDDAQVREEKRKLRKLKGKEKKEAQLREQEYAARRGDESRADQKEKDRLNRDLQEYESYERKRIRE